MKKNFVNIFKDDETWNEILFVMEEFLLVAIPKKVFFYNFWLSFL